MRIVFTFFILIILISCDLTKYTPQKFSGKKFEWGQTPSMLGKSIIEFKDDSTFVYSERDSLFVCTGTWYLSTGSKKISIKGAYIPLNNNLNPPIKIRIDKEFKIINTLEIRDLDDLRLFQIKR
jgi:hypothetical protein